MNKSSISRVPRIDADQENARLVPLGPSVATVRRDPVEPVPIGVYVACVFRVTGYDQDCDGSLMAQLEAVDATGEATGWTVDCIGLYPDTAWVLDTPDALDHLDARPARS